LKYALHRGESLKQAMMSFYNAGYKKHDIEEAARNLHTQQDVIPKQHQVQHADSSNVVSSRPEKPKQNYRPLNQPKPSMIQQEIKRSPPKFFKDSKPAKRKPVGSLQLISNYQPNDSKSGKKVVVVLVILVFLILLSSAIIYFFFKEKALEIYNSLFGLYYGIYL